MKRILWITLAAFVIASLAVYWLAHSPWLAEKVRVTAVAEITRLTNATVEVERAHVDWRHRSVVLTSIVLHGTEPAGTPPLLRARSVTVGLRNLNLRPQIASIEIDSPEASIRIDAGGSSNLPQPNDRQSGSWFDSKLGRLEVRNGALTIGDRRIPLEGRAFGIEAASSFRPGRELYEGSVRAQRVETRESVFAAQFRFELTREGVRFPELHVSTAQSRVDGAAAIRDWTSLRGEAQLAVHAVAADARPIAGWNGLREGTADAELTAVFDSSGWRMTGPLRTSGLRLILQERELPVRAATAIVTWGPDGIRFDRLEAAVWDGSLRGSLGVNPSGFQFIAEATNVRPPGDLAARVTGRVEASGDGKRLAAAMADVMLTPAAGRVPAAGTIRARYVAPEELHVALASLRFGESRLQVEGDVNQSLRFELRTRQLEELLPVASFAGWTAPVALPVSLDGQLAVITGTVEGAVSDPAVRANVQAARIRWMDRRFDSVEAVVTASKDRLRVLRARAGLEGASIEGTLQAALVGWALAPSSSFEGNGRASGINLAPYAKDVAGVASASLTLAGTMANPSASGSVRIANAAWRDIALGDIDAEVEWTKDRVRVPTARIRHGTNRARATASWTPQAIAVAASIVRWRLDKSRGLPSDAEVRGAVQASLASPGGRWALARLDGNLTATLAGGTALITARTQDSQVSIDAALEMGGANIEAVSRWSLDGSMRGAGEIRAREFGPEAIRLLSGKSSSSPWPFTAKLSGTARFEGSLLEPRAITGKAALDRVELAPASNNVPPGLTVADLTLRNEGAVIFTATQTSMTIEQARFVAKDTNVEARGGLSLTRTQAWNLLIRGQVNLAVVGTFRPDLVSAGRSTLEARVRGAIDQPDVDGRLEFRDASFYLRDVSNGLDQVNGAIRFDRTRATIETLTAQSGGGNVGLSGFVGFGSDPSYQLQAQLAQVRIRYPEGVSTTANASLSLSGTMRRALLAGTVTILRAGLTPLTDVGGLLAKSASGSLGSPENPLLRALQYDIRVETAQSAEFSTSLTRNVQGDVDLRLRGTFQRPSLLGRISITQGGVQFFGTDYTINRGEINFVNPVRVDPIVDLDLETQVRGIVVSITFAGPLNKMNMSYRSDPPLQSSEILALLAVGRTPSAATSLRGAGVNGRDLIASGGNAIVNSAVASGGGSSSLQRFFGVTRLKIDPQLIGLDNTPQARVSFEQQISRDVTVTYVQALNRAQQQLVRVEWDFNKQWSAIATRDENGVLSVDFVYRRSFR